MKLNYKRTILVGFAFFLISMFWQAYDNIVPKILTNQFGLPQTWSGLIMALDNILALFLLPLFGSLSDRSKSKHGRRTPFIVVGTVLAAISLLLLSVPDNIQLNKMNAIRGTEGEAYTESLGVIWDENPSIRWEDEAEDESFWDSINPFHSGNKKSLQEIISREEFVSIPMELPEDAPDDAEDLYTKYVVPARQAYVARVTAANPSPLIFFVLLLLVVLVSMGTFRSPAVALMPDVTLKPLRSKGNAIINLMGAVGGVLVLLLGIVFGTGKAQNALMSYTTFFLIIAAMMLLALFVFCRFVKEPLWAKEMEEESERLGLNVEEEPAEATAPARRLSKTEKTSLLLILASVALWYIGYNAVTTKYSVYAESVLNMDYNTTLLIAQAAAIISYLPVGMVASRIGRKKTILAGVVMLTVAFAGAYFVVPGVSPVLMTAFFALAGIAWATINVNSFPMVVELAKGGDVGKYTGFYYTASMSAQIVTPVLSGFLMDAFGMRNVLFPYAAIACALAFVTMFFVRHGDSRPVAKKGLEALDADD